MTNCSHHKKVCAACETVMEQCRCMDQNKSITYTICNKCKDRTISPKVFVRQFIRTYEDSRNQLFESDIKELYKEAKRIEGVLDGRV